MENKYHTAQVYSITSKKTKQVYIGSTIQTLEDRFRQHKCKYKQYLNKKGPYTTSFELLKHDDAVINLLEIYKCENEDELFIKECEWINKTPDCVNKIKCNINKKIKANKYDNGKIYKMFNPKTNKVYIGSTIRTLIKRLAAHLRDYKRYQKGKCNFFASFEITKYNDTEIILIEPYPCKNKEELLEREQYWIDNTENCVNKQNAFGRNKEKVKIKSKKDYVKRHDKILENKKIYREKNKDKIKEKAKIYMNNLNMEAKEKQKICKRRYDEKNREKIKKKVGEQIVCECGCSIRRDGLFRHKKSLKHKQFLENK